MFLPVYLSFLFDILIFVVVKPKTNVKMKTLLGLLLLLSLQVYAGTASMGGDPNDEVDIELKEGNSDNKDRHPRSILPVSCVYTDGMVQLTLLGEVGEYTLTVTNQMTGERWSVSNASVLPTSTANGMYEVQIVTEDGSMYYGTYTLH